MNQDIINYCQWQNDQLYFLLEELHMNHINPNYGFELHTAVDMNNQNEWQSWNGCKIMDLPRIEGIAIDNDSRKIIIFFYNGDLLKDNRIEDGIPAYDFLLINFKDIIGVRLEADARRVYEVTADEGILPSVSIHQYRNINEKLYPHNISLVIATRRANAQIIRFDVSLNETGMANKIISDTMNGIFSNDNKKISVLGGVDKESYIFCRKYMKSTNVQLLQMVDVKKTIHSFAVHIGSVVHAKKPRQSINYVCQDEFMRTAL